VGYGPGVAGAGSPNLVDVVAVLEYVPFDMVVVGLRVGVGRVVILGVEFFDVSPCPGVQDLCYGVRGHCVPPARLIPALATPPLGPTVGWSQERRGKLLAAVGEFDVVRFESLDCCRRFTAFGLGAMYQQGKAFLASYGVSFVMVNF
jgi:hypothetical protein